jgi:hypothetical protein
MEYHYEIAAGKCFEVKETNGKFFYYSKSVRRWMPVAKAKVKPGNFAAAAERCKQRNEVAQMRRQY